VLIDRPQSPQSLHPRRAVLLRGGHRGHAAADAANEVLGGDFLSRINMDLRETKGWSYGAFGPGCASARCPTSIQAPVQADRTGDSIRALMEQVSRLPGAKRRHRRPSCSG
jgi:zinc protease